jgi:hypothetical protein
VFESLDVEGMASFTSPQRIWILEHEESGMMVDARVVEPQSARRPRSAS